MSDVRALLPGRGIKVGDGAYLERAEQAVHSVEEWLRGQVANWASGTARRSGPFVQQINALETAVQSKDDEGLRQALRAVAKRMQQAGFCDDLLIEAFALIREAAQRSLGKRHYDVQLLAGQALLRGRVAEMATGEGKTLAATLAVCTAALAGAAVHVVTVNDYLAERDADDNSPLFTFLGLTVGVIKQDMPIDERRSLYARDVVYVSNKELTFDYLKDRIALGATLAAQLR